MKKLLKRLWWKWVIYPYLMKNKAICSVALRDAIVWQCWSGGMQFSQVNKWLRATGQATIKAYVIENAQPRIFYEMPDAQRRGTINGRLVTVLQN